MIMDVLHFLAITIVHDQAKMVGEAKLVSHGFDGVVEHGKNFWRSVEEVRVFLFWNNEQMDRVFRSVIRDHDNALGFVKDFGREIPVDYASKNG